MCVPSSVLVSSACRVSSLVTNSHRVSSLVSVSVSSVRTRQRVVTRKRVCRQHARDERRCEVSQSLVTLAGAKRQREASVRSGSEKFRVKRCRVATVSELDCRIVRQRRGNDHTHSTTVSVVRGRNDNSQSSE